MGNSSSTDNSAFHNTGITHGTDTNWKKDELNVCTGPESMTLKLTVKNDSNIQSKSESMTPKLMPKPNQRN